MINALNLFDFTILWYRWRGLGIAQHSTQKWVLLLPPPPLWNDVCKHQMQARESLAGQYTGYGIRVTVKTCWFLVTLKAKHFKSYKDWCQNPDFSKVGDAGAWYLKWWTCMVSIHLKLWSNKNYGKWSALFSHCSECIPRWQDPTDSTVQVQYYSCEFHPSL